MSEPIEPATPEAVQAPVDESPRYLVGVRLREPLLTEDYQTTDPDLHVGDFVLVETGGGTVLGEVRRPKRPVPSFKLDRVYRRVVRRANGREVADWRERRALEVKGVETCARTARTRGLAMKIVDVEMDPSRRRVTVFFNSEERVDFRDLVRDLAREFDPISVKMAKAQDMPLTDSRLLGNCGRLKCCLLYEFSTYEALRSRLPRVNSPCSASCGGGGCMTGKVRSLRVLKQSVVVGFPDGTEAEVPLDQLTWEGRDHIKPA